LFDASSDTIIKGVSHGEAVVHGERQCQCSVVLEDEIVTGPGAAERLRIYSRVRLSHSESTLRRIGMRAKVENATTVSVHATMWARCGVGLDTPRGERDTALVSFPCSCRGFPLADVLLREPASPAVVGRQAQGAMAPIQRNKEQRS
jgi:hypothetical protein